MVYCLIERSNAKRNRWLPYVLVFAAIILLILYASGEHFSIFFTCYSLLVAFIMGRSAHFAYAVWKRRHSPSDHIVLALFMGSHIAYIVGFTLWLIDNIACHRVQHLQLHSLWHIMAGESTDIEMLMGMVVKETGSSKGFLVHWMGHNYTPLNMLSFIVLPQDLESVGFCTWTQCSCFELNVMLNWCLVFVQISGFNFKLRLGLGR